MKIDGVKRAVGFSAWLVTMLALPACSAPSDAPSGSGGKGASPAGTGGAAAVAGTGGAGVSGGATGGSAGTGGAGGQPGVSCPETPVPLRTSGAVVELDVGLALGGAPVAFGEPNAIPGGGTLLPLNVRFYVSEVALIPAAGDPIPVDIVGTDGKPVSFGIQLVNAEDSESLRLRLLAPTGSYAGVSFTLGISDACNRGSDSRKAPLSSASQMTWPHTGGYLFLRYEAMVTAGQGATTTDGGAGAAPGSPPGAIHVGGIVGRVFATRVKALGSVVATSGAATRSRLQLDLDELFRMATSNIDVNDSVLHPLPEIIRGERVRRLAPESMLFILSAP